MIMMIEVVGEVRVGIREVRKVRVAEVIRGQRWSGWSEWTGWFETKRSQEQPTS